MNIWDKLWVILFITVFGFLIVILIREAVRQICLGIEALMGMDETDISEQDQDIGYQEQDQGHESDN